MNKKALRKELENALVKSIQETLNTRNAIAGKKIKHKIENAAKSVAKKFYKAIKTLNEDKLNSSKSATGKATVSKTIPARRPRAKTPLKKKK
jgi:imidazoleglycerol phosphate dehydratase HisB